MTFDDYFCALERAHEGEVPLDEAKVEALKHEYAHPLWVVAGPGTGKTHLLTYLVPKRVLVDEVDAEDIFLTTFTKKAASELETRLLRIKQKLEDEVDVSAIDIAQMRIGTLHSLCLDIMREYRYEPIKRCRVLEDEVAQRFFIRRNPNSISKCRDEDFWDRFLMAKERGENRYSPNASGRADNTAKIVNRITEMRVDLEDLRDSGESHLELLADGYEEYVESLRESFRTDQALIQKHFLDFLETDRGQEWLADGRVVLVDEYQDTNPIQEEIYFRLIGGGTDLTVVGDDDQSLYRFRGATVESFIFFDEACKARDVPKPSSPTYLKENRRSHPKIIRWINRFIQHHPDMQNSDDVQVRAPEKPELEAKSQIEGDYESVITIPRSTTGSAVRWVRELILDLKQSGRVDDYSQIAVLAWSTKETGWGIGRYVDALRGQEPCVPVYNPRNKQVHNTPQFKRLLGAVLSILDPDLDFDSLPASLTSNVKEYAEEALEEYKNIVSGDYSELQRYVEETREVIESLDIDEETWLSKSGDEGRRVTISSLFYKLLAHSPFAEEFPHLDEGERMKQFNIVLDDYEAEYNDGFIKVEPFDGEARVEKWTRFNLYSVLVDGLISGLNEPEDDEIVLREGAVNVMTIHQAKGLEFEVVIVLRPENHPYVGDTHALEDELEPYARKKVTRPGRSREKRAIEDAVRLFYVAYSRAKRLLVIAGKDAQNWEPVIGHTEENIPLNNKDNLKNYDGIYVK